MRKIRVFAHDSLYGVISPESGNAEYSHGGWTSPFRSPAVAEAQGTGFDFLLGRRTYDLWAGHRPKAPSSPIADAINSAKKYVVTHRPESLGWGPSTDSSPTSRKGFAT